MQQEDNLDKINKLREEGRQKDAAILELKNKTVQLEDEVKTYLGRIDDL